MKLSVFDELLHKSFDYHLEEPIPVSESANEEYMESEDKLFEQFSETQNELFERYDFARFAVEEERIDYRFKLGFRYGLLLAIESCYLTIPTPAETLDELRRNAQRSAREQRHENSERFREPSESAGAEGKSGWENDDPAPSVPAEKAADEKVNAFIKAE